MTDPTMLQLELDTMRSDLERAQAQHQQELVHIMTWQKRMRSDNERLAGQIDKIIESISDLLAHAQSAGAGPDTLNALSAARATIFYCIEGDVDL